MAALSDVVPLAVPASKQGSGLRLIVNVRQVPKVQRPSASDGEWQVPGGGCRSTVEAGDSSLTLTRFRGHLITAGATRSTVESLASGAGLGDGRLGVTSGEAPCQHTDTVARSAAR